MTDNRALMTVAAIVLCGCGGSGGGSGAVAAPVAVAPSPTPTATATTTPAPTPTTTSVPVATDPPVPDEAPACVTAVADPLSLSPYSDPAFRTTLDNSRFFQWPASVNACMRTSDLQASRIDPANWYRDSAGRMVFAFRNGVHDDDSQVTTRMELRGESFAGGATGKSLDASFQLPEITGRSTSFTVAQVYGESAGLPILRIAYVGQRSGVSNHVWAVYRRGSGSGEATFYDLGEAPAPGATMRVRVAYNVNNAIEVESSGLAAPLRLDTNFDFWTAAGKTTYFKAGCYLQAAGACEVRFTALRFDR